LKNWEGFVDFCPSCGQEIKNKKLRSTGPFSQNHHYNAHVAQIARETGNDFDDVKIGIKARAVKRGFPEPRVRKAGGRTYEVWKSESDCSTVECAMLIDECHQVADELNIILREEA
jgi:hypothetical protein